MHNNQKKFWPALSLISIFAWGTLASFLLLEINIHYFAKTLTVIFNVVLLPSILLAGELMGFRKKLWKLWQNLPKKIHKKISIICLFWIVTLSSKGLMLFFKNKNNEQSNK